MEPDIQNITDRLPSSRGVYQDPTDHELELAVTLTHGSYAQLDRNQI
jgi:hypothetical protein